jgi:hypothetical protein
MSRGGRGWEVTMRKAVLVVGFLFLAGTLAQAQHGTASPGYYPPGYSGDTWTGTVTSVNDQTREIALTYTNNDKTESFTGILQAGYKVKLKDGTTKELKPSDIPISTRLIVYYITETKKMDGKKVKTYEIFKLIQTGDDQKK